MNAPRHLRCLVPLLAAMACSHTNPEFGQSTEGETAYEAGTTSGSTRTVTTASKPDDDGTTDVDPTNSTSGGSGSTTTAPPTDTGGGSATTNAATTGGAECVAPGDVAEDYVYLYAFSQMVNGSIDVGQGPNGIARAFNDCASEGPDLCNISVPILHSEAGWAFLEAPPDKQVVDGGGNCVLADHLNTLTTDGSNLPLDDVLIDVFGAMRPARFWIGTHETAPDSDCANWTTTGGTGHLGRIDVGPGFLYSDDVAAAPCDGNNVLLCACWLFDASGSTGGSSGGSTGGTTE